MQSLRHVSRQSSRTSYICLSCRLQSQSPSSDLKSALERRNLEHGEARTLSTRSNQKENRDSKDAPNSQTSSRRGKTFRKVHEADWPPSSQHASGSITPVRRVKAEANWERLPVRRYEGGLPFPVRKHRGADRVALLAQDGGAPVDEMQQRQEGEGGGAEKSLARRQEHGRKSEKRQLYIPVDVVREEAMEDEVIDGLIDGLIERHVELGGGGMMSGQIEEEVIDEEELLEEEQSFRRDGQSPTSRADLTSHSLSGDPASSRSSLQTYRPSSSPWTVSDAADKSKPLLTSTGFDRPQARPFHTSSRVQQQTAAASLPPDLEQFPLASSPPPVYDSSKEIPIREQLRQWQERYGNLPDPAENIGYEEDSLDGGPTNNYLRLPHDQNAFNNPELEEEEAREAFDAFSRSQSEDLVTAVADTRFLQIGDLVELEYPGSERDPVIGVFVRRFGASKALVFTMNGRFAFVLERFIQFSVPGFISPDLIDPIVPYLPDVQSFIELEEYMKSASERDISIPREASASLVSRLVQFHTESQDIYRRHASALDGAHETLAHESDLRYGSLTSAATALLRIPANELTPPALFTVRKALSRAQFAFSIDRRSHRLTGYLQIRSKQQVKMVDQVREWLRDWQDDLAARAAIEAEEDVEKRQKMLRKHKTPRTAQILYDFIEKARKIILKSREDRDPTPYGFIGPSKKRFPITKNSGAMRITTDSQFTEEESEVVKFVEVWAASKLFLGVPRLESLPPLILQGTGLYKDMDMRTGTGYLFLQELGTVMPYDNRVRFDPNLLLPSSQHSKPLQKLMSSLLEMETDHTFVDSMKDIRHDWKDLPVYCIDDAGAQEIDDGISIEWAGEGEWWVHIHIANPTAFFERDHALAKMARHMGETIYMPERTYGMLPRWATSQHFSIAKDRPCLTFSVRMDSEGRTLENKVQAGRVRNVIKLTPDEVRRALGAEEHQVSKVVLTVGGQPPPARPRMSRYNFLTEENRAHLRALSMLAHKRSDIRRKAGGVFMDTRQAEVSVWQRWESQGLGWDNPHRIGSRTVEGDPVIRMECRPLVNWFKPREGVAEIVVREMMLLACETAGRWCAARRVPGIFRGMVERPDQQDPAAFLRDVLIPATEKTSDGVYPMYLGIQYLALFGTVANRAMPFRHQLVGLDYYSKVTSPLRRYGDMVMHWQIEAALREEARTGRSLASPSSDDAHADAEDRTYLPFSTAALDAMSVSLQPREKLVNGSKRYASEFWIAMVLFRALHFGEAELPFYTTASPTFPSGAQKPYMRVFLSSLQTPHKPGIGGICIDLNCNVTLLRPDKLGMTEALAGDTWEGELVYVDMDSRDPTVKPVRLVDRPEFARRIV